MAENSIFISILYRILSLVAILFCYIDIACISGCHSSNPDPSTLVFKDVKSMREALNGTWILKEYEDSIDAGLTPKLLEYMLDKRYWIGYFPNDKAPSGDPVHTAYAKGGWGNKEEHISLDFRNADNRIIFRSMDSIDQPKPNNVYDAEFIINGADTTLRFYDSLSAPLDFVKYDNPKCPYIDAYHHLVNSKFIAGKYFSLNDEAKSRHIIFTKCGTIEGIDNIDTSLHGKTQYEVKLSYFKTDPDIIDFVDLQNDLTTSYYWQVDHDSLILCQDAQDREKQIVLVKAF